MKDLTRFSSPSLSRSQAVMVRFPYADGSPMFIFGSLAAIFEVFTEKEIGASLAALYSLRLSEGSLFRTPAGVDIKKVPVFRKKHRSCG